MVLILLLIKYAGILRRRNGIAIFESTMFLQKRAAVKRTFSKNSVWRNSVVGIVSVLCYRNQCVMTINSLQSDFVLAKYVRDKKKRKRKSKKTIVKKVHL